MEARARAGPQGMREISASRDLGGCQTPIHRGNVTAHRVKRVAAANAPTEETRRETMKIVQTDPIPLKRGLEPRGGTFHGRIMVEGEAGALDNFQLSFGQMGGDFNSPRH